MEKKQLTMDDVIKQQEKIRQSIMKKIEHLTMEEPDGVKALDWVQSMPEHWQTRLAGQVSVFSFMKMPLRAKDILKSQELLLVILSEEDEDLLKRLLSE